MAAIAVLFAFLTWEVRAHLVEALDAVLVGAAIGGVCAYLYWRGLRRKIRRKTRTANREAVEINIISVRFISIFEMLLTVVLLSPIGVVIVGVTAFIAFVLVGDAGHWWAVLIGCCGLSGSAALVLIVFNYEKVRGRLYYEYDSGNWGGREGMLNKVGYAESQLNPKGLVKIGGELWTGAVLRSGEVIEAGEKIEVVEVDGLTLYIVKVDADN